jgi:UDP-N-acetylmuramoyl-tripeptide--D-alanyl-D-alanine ligase
MALWTWHELALACGVDQGNKGPDVNGISIDTRTLASGDLFIALSGDPGPGFHSSFSHSRDGHEFVEIAESSGAAAILVSRETNCQLPEIRVSNTLDGLWALGEAGRRRMAGRVVGITGSSGKTTARSWLESMLREEVKTHASPGSYNNHWGVPLSLARMPRDSEIGIFEIGMNNPGEIAPLSKLVKPDVALVLNVLPVHLAGFENLDGIRHEKLSIAHGLDESGVLVVHEDVATEGVIHKDIVTFGLSALSTVSARISPEQGVTRVQVSVDAVKYQFTLPVEGEHRLLTALGCLAVVHALGGDLKRACNALASMEAPAGRGNLREVSGRRIIDDSYNANPVSMRYALEALGRSEGGKKVALLGEMLELGGESEQLHASILDLCGKLDGVITVGDGFSSAEQLLGDNHWHHYASATDIDPAELAARLHEGDTLLIKGSKKVFWVYNFADALVSALS